MDPGPRISSNDGGLRLTQYEAFGCRFLPGRRPEGGSDRASCQGASGRVSKAAVHRAENQSPLQEPAGFRPLQRWKVIPGGLERSSCRITETEMCSQPSRHRRWDRRQATGGLHRRERATEGSLTGRRVGDQGLLHPVRRQDIAADAVRVGGGGSRCRFHHAVYLSRDWPVFLMPRLAVGCCMVGDRHVVGITGGARAFSGHEHHRAIGAHRDGPGNVVKVPRPVEAIHPELGTARGGIGQRGIVVKGLSPGAFPGYKYRRTVRAHREGTRYVPVVPARFYTRICVRSVGPVTGPVVPSDPEFSSVRHAVGDGRVSNVAVRGSWIPSTFRLPCQEKVRALYRLVPPAGLEPAASCSGGKRSIL